MRYERPELLYLALVAAPVVLLYLIRRRRRRVPVPSLLLWEKMLARTASRASLGVLSSVLSLLLTVAAIGAASLAAAGPRTGAPPPAPRHLLLCLGGSARMAGERWERAVALAIVEVRRKAAFDPVTVLVVSERPRILAARETDPARVAARLERARPGLVTAAWELAAPALARAVAAGDRAVAIGVRPEAPAGVAVHGVGGVSSGLTALGVRVTGDRVLALVRTAGAEPEAEIVATLGSREVLRRPAAEEFDLDLPRGEGGLLRVSLEPARGPAFDDAAEAWVPPPRALRLGVAAEGGPDPFLRSALAAAGPLLSSEGSRSVEPGRLAEAASRFDVVVIAGEAPGTLPPGDFVLLTPPPESLGFTTLPAVEASPVWEVGRDHPVTRGVDAAEVQVTGAAPARLPASATPLLTVPGGAVAAVGEREGVRYVWIGLGPDNSTLPVTAAYPILLRNALAWLASLREAPLPAAFRTDLGLEPEVPLPPGTEAVGISGPGPEGGAVVAVEAGRFSWHPEPAREGEVEVRIGSAVHRTRANVILPGETAAQPLPGEPVLGPDRRGLRSEERELWLLLTVAAALLLLLERVVSLRSREL